MAELKGLFQIYSAGDEAPDDAVRFDGFGDGGERPRSREQLMRFGKLFADRITVLLAHWNSRRIEREAFSYALRWDGSSHLASEVDTAFQYCLAWTQEVAELYREVASRSVLLPSEAAPYQALELVRQNLMQLLMELRSRWQFLSARAADIRMSGDLKAVASALVSLESERLAEKVVAALQRGETAELGRIREQHPELEQADPADVRRLGETVADKARGRGFDVRDWLSRNGAQIALGVGSNAAYGFLKSMFPGFVP
jgi:hypothetical protein